MYLYNLYTYIYKFNVDVSQTTHSCHYVVHIHVGAYTQFKYFTVMGPLWTCPKHHSKFTI